MPKAFFAKAADTETIKAEAKEPALAGAGIREKF